MAKRSFRPPRRLNFGLMAVIISSLVTGCATTPKQPANTRSALFERPKFEFTTFGIAPSPDKDLPFIKAMAQAMEKRGYKVYYDEQIKQMRRSLQKETEPLDVKKFRAYDIDLYLDISAVYAGRPHPVKASIFVRSTRDGGVLMILNWNLPSNAPSNLQQLYREAAEQIVGHLIWRLKKGKLSTALPIELKSVYSSPQSFDIRSTWAAACSSDIYWRFRASIFS